jgi:hypothetical protein
VARNAIALSIDCYLRTKPTADMRAAVEQVEISVAIGDHTVGLL